MKISKTFFLNVIDIDNMANPRIAPSPVRMFGELRKELPMFQIGTARQVQTSQYDESQAEGLNRRTSENVQRGDSRGVQQQVQRMAYDETSPFMDDKRPLMMQQNTNQMPFARERQAQLNPQMRSNRERGMRRHQAPTLTHNGFNAPYNPFQTLTTLPLHIADQKAQLSQTLSQISKTPNLITKPNEVVVGKKRNMNVPMFGNQVPGQPAFQIGDQQLEETNLRDDARFNFDREQAGANPYMNENNLGVDGQTEFMNLAMTMKRKATNPLHVASFNESTVLNQIHDNERDILTQNVNKEISANQTASLGDDGTITSPIIGKSIIQSSKGKNKGKDRSRIAKKTFKRDVLLKSKGG